jgi:8-oxo-dGTP pyrophosphatase MutT (NUDIX family)
VRPSPEGPRRSIDELLGRYPVERPPLGTAGAAVTIVLRSGLTETEILLIERASDAADPASGQVAFPGGHVSERDGNLLDTAFRELEEEVGVGRDDFLGDVHYVATELARRFGLQVAVFAGRLGPRGRGPVPHSPREVAHVFWLPESTLASTTRVERDTPRGAALVNATVYEGHVLWGFTRRVLRQFMGHGVEDEPYGPAFSTAAPGPI